jgi:hypothetical protein
MVSLLGFSSEVGADLRGEQDSKEEKRNHAEASEFFCYADKSRTRKKGRNSLLQRVTPEDRFVPLAVQIFGEQTISSGFCNRHSKPRKNRSETGGAKLCESVVRVGQPRS